MAKIPFDIKYRPQIESGEYKLETECGHTVSIMDWEWIDHNEKKCLAVKVLMDEGFNIGYLFDYDGKRHSIFPSDSDSDLFIVTPEEEQRFSEFELKMRKIRDLYIAMQEQGVDDRYGDAVSASLPEMIKWLTDKIELAKREREFNKAVYIGPEELTPFESGVLNMIDDIVKCITYPNDSCIPNVHTVASELLALAREQLIKDGYVIEKKAFHDAVENISDKHRAEMSVEYSLHCKVEDGTRHAIMNWSEFQKVAQKFIDIGRAEALKDLPRWRDDDLPEGCTMIDIGVLYGFDFIRRHRKLLRISDLEKLPGFKED